MKITIAGIDPALANFGLAKVEYDLETDTFSPIAIKLVQTEKRTGKTVRQNSDDIRRASELCSGMHDWIKDCHVVFAEIPTGSQSARGAFSNGTCLGILASIGKSTGYSGRLIQVLPHEVKLAAVGSKHASKSEMIEWGYELYPELDWFMHRGKPQNKNEHMADALASIHAGLMTDEFANLAQSLNLIVKTQNQD
jgi:Holliday junction resolvasome RuvABC endonuclease subunit